MKLKAELMEELDQCYGERYGLHDERARAALFLEVLIDIRDSLQPKSVKSGCRYDANDGGKHLCWSCY